jgi:HAAS
MMNATVADRLVAEYLARLDAALRDLPAARREELVEQVSEHIATARAELGDQAGKAEIRTLLDRLGDPAAIAAEASRRPADSIESSQPRPGWREIAALPRWRHRHTGDRLVCRRGPAVELGALVRTQQGARHAGCPRRARSPALPRDVHRLHGVLQHAAGAGRRRLTSLGLHRKAPRLAGGVRPRGARAAAGRSSSDRHLPRPPAAAPARYRSGDAVGSCLRFGCGKNATSQRTYQRQRLRPPTRERPSRWV